MHELLVQWVGYLVPWIEAIGIVVVLWGVLEAIMGLLRRGWAVLTSVVYKDLGAGIDETAFRENLKKLSGR